MTIRRYRGVSPELVRYVFYISDEGQATVCVLDGNRERVVWSGPSSKEAVYENIRSNVYER